MKTRNTSFNHQTKLRMYIQTQMQPTTLNVNNSYQGETIEQKIFRIVNNKEPITDGAPLIYTERHEGVKPEYDIRTDRFEVAAEAMDTVTKTHLAKRKERIDTWRESQKTPEQKAAEAAAKIQKEGRTQSIQATDTK